MIYTLTLNTSLDYVAHVDKLSVGNIHKTVNYSLYPGGKGINVSQVLAQLGVDNTALGFVAGHTGTCLESLMADRHIDTDFVHLSSGITRINMKIRSKNELFATEETDINGVGPNITDEEKKELLGKLAVVTSDDTVIVSGSVPPTVSVSEYENIIASIANQGAVLVVDAIGKYLEVALKYKPFLIKPNRDELYDFFGKQYTGDSDEVQLEEYAAKLAQMGAVNVLVSLGGDGALLYSRQPEGMVTYRKKAPKIDVISTVGAGDSMVAGFIAGYRAKQDVEYAMLLGICAGSATTMSEGLANCNAVEQLMEQYRQN